MILAVLFYVGLGAFIFYAIWGPKDQKAGTHQTTTTHPTHNSSAALPNDGTRVIIVGGAVGLLVVVGLAWIGGKYGSGNSLFPKSGGGNSYQPFNGSQPTPDVVWVDGYYRRDGIYVPGHYRSRADGDPSNNWSNYPNVNPYTGKPGTNRPNGR